MLTITLREECYSRIAVVMKLHSKLEEQLRNLDKIYLKALQKGCFHTAVAIAQCRQKLTVLKIKSLARAREIKNDDYNYD